MEKVDIIAHGAHGNAFPGNKEWLGIAVCVTRADAEPVSGLSKNNFKVRALLTNGTHVGTAIKLFIDYQQGDPALAGYYSLFVATTDNNIWVQGECVFAVTVASTRGTKSPFRGRTLAVVDIPHLPG